MYRGYNQVFWGLLIASFSININNFRILPATLGFLMILMGTVELYKVTHIDSFRIAKIFSAIHVVITFLQELYAFGVIPFEFTHIFLINELVFIGVTVIELVMMYKIIEGAILYEINDGKEDLAQEYTKKLRSYTVVCILAIMALCVGRFYSLMVVLGISGIVMFGARVYIILLIRKIKNSYPDDIAPLDMESE